MRRALGISRLRPQPENQVPPLHGRHNTEGAGMTLNTATKPFGRDFVVMDVSVCAPPQVPAFIFLPSFSRTNNTLLIIHRVYWAPAAIWAEACSAHRWRAACGYYGCSGRNEPRVPPPAPPTAGSSNPVRSPTFPGARSGLATPRPGPPRQTRPAGINRPDLARDNCGVVSLEKDCSTSDYHKG